ncbi:putative ABC transporter permease [Acetivibrio cellulolyticus]|uniref:putative ABC transporter permease n=1 Tax=Acetivibrio cellulolyticus TaxID=35830 RepID=UPI0001E2D88C|nr:putative ABC transporter permease [Acetivibrio cellulolyticus]
MELYIFWYFFIYAFIGWCVEVIYAAADTGKFVNRGFLNGPVCPIYGIGFITVLYLLNPVKDNLLYMFLGAVFITSTVELIGGFLLEKIFHQKWWDYSDKPFNIGGYICPMFSIMWGIACIVFVDRIHPLIFSLSSWIPKTASKILLIVFTGLFILDLIATVKSILRLNKKLEVIDEITSKIRETSDSIGEKIANGTISIVQKKANLEESLSAKGEVLKSEIAKKINFQEKMAAHQNKTLSDLYKRRRELLESNPFGQARLLKAFPGLKSIDHKEALEKLRSSFLKGLKTPKKIIKNSKRR